MALVIITTNASINNNFFMIIKKNYKIVALIIFMVIVVAYNTKESLERLFSNVGHLLVTTKDSREERAYEHMGYGFIKKIVNPIEDMRLMPRLQYVGYDYGVKVFLKGSRNNLNEDIIIVIDLDKALTKRNGSPLECKKIAQDKSTLLRCLMPKESYHVTGVKFLGSIVENQIYNIQYLANGQVINSYDFSSKDVFHTKKIGNILKIPVENSDYYNSISNNEVSEKYLEIVIQGEVGQHIPDFIVTGHVKDIGDHYILRWDERDARNYVAILKNAIDADANTADPELQKVVRRLIGGV